MRLIRPRKTSGFRPTEGKTHPIESTNQITRLGWHQGCPTFRKYPLKYSRSKGIAGSTRPFAFFLSFRTVVPFRNRSIFPADQGPAKITKIVLVERIGSSEARFRRSLGHSSSILRFRWTRWILAGRFSFPPFFFLFFWKSDREENRGRPR